MGECFPSTGSPESSWRKGRKMVVVVVIIVVV